MFSFKKSGERPTNFAGDRISCTQRPGSSAAQVSISFFKSKKDSRNFLNPKASIDNLVLSHVPTSKSCVFVW